MKTHEQYIAERRTELADLAVAIIRGEIDPVAGIRLIEPLMAEVELDELVVNAALDESVLNDLKCFESETDFVPDKEQRSLYAPDYLVSVDARLGSCLEIGLESLKESLELLVKACRDTSGG